MASIMTIFGEEAPPVETPSEPSGPEEPVMVDVTDLVKQASQHYEKAQENLKAGDWAGFGEEWDAMGEVVNMVGGKFKAIFAEKFNDGMEAFKMSIPSVIMGDNYEIHIVGSDSFQETVIGVNGECFSVKVALKKVEPM